LWKFIATSGCTETTHIFTLMQTSYITDIIKTCAKDSESLQKLTQAFSELQSKVEKAETNLRLLESAIRNDYDSILITEMDMDNPGPRIVYVNDGFTKMTGYTRDEAIGQTPRILQGAKTDRAVLDKLRGALSNGRPFFGQTVNYRKDGSEFVNQWDIHPLIDDKGEVTHWVSYQHDITERKRAELSILSHATDTDELYEDSKRTILDLGEDGSIVGANKAFRDMIGYFKDEIKNARIWDVMPVKFGNSLQTQYDRLWREDFQQGKTYRLMLRHKNGLPIQIELQTKLMDVPSGTFMRCDVRNLTLRKRILSTLKKRNSDYTQLFERKIDFNYGLILDEMGEMRFKWLSDGFTKVSGYSVDECLCGNGWKKLIHEDDTDKVRNHLMAAFEGRSSTENYRIVTKSGEIRNIMDYAKPDAEDQNGQAQAVVASAIDVTNRKESVV
jgi:PAS domain S-box-containing protein